MIYNLLITAIIMCLVFNAALEKGMDNYKKPYSISKRSKESSR